MDKRNFQSFGLILTLLLESLFGCTKEKVPTISTVPVTNILSTSAVSGGEITDEGSSTIISKGVCWSTALTPTLLDNKTTDGTGAGNFTSVINDLNGGTTYYVRAYATNNYGTGYGMTLSFITLGQLPSAFANPATNITSSSATLSGLVNPNYLSTNVYFEIGLNSSYGLSVAANQNPIEGNTSTSASVTINGLVSTTTYHFRIKATNSLGTYLGNDMTFTTTGKIGDIDGNQYNTVAIGSQVWMVENLRTTKYSDGTNISFPNNDNIAWQSNTTGAYAWYDNNETNKNPYGALYNWYAVNTNKLCPIGWHVPTDADWTSLTTYLGGNDVAGGKLKETGVTHWNTPNSGATNISGFTALPGGDRLTDGSYTYFGNGGIYWSCTSKDNYDAWFRALDKSTASIGRAELEKGVGLSVRCLKD